jgi:hypothetical protein
MALEAADKAANINQIYSAGATKQQWDAFVAEYRVRQILWVSDNPGKATGGAERAAIFSRRYDAGRSRDRMHPAHARMVVPQHDVRPGGWRHGVCQRQPHKQQNGQWQTFCSLVRIWSVSVAEQHDCVHEQGAILWLKA